MADSDLDRLYTMLTEKVGFARVRDVRLEKIAADRALEMRIHQGLLFDPNNPLIDAHERNQISARVYPWEPVDGVTENLTWHYYPPSWVDPIEAAVGYTFPNEPEVYGMSAGAAVGWWNSDIHRSQLLNTRWTHWGMGIYYEDTSLGARRWYFTTVFATPMDELATRTVTLLAGKQFGFDLTADGKQIHRHIRTLTTNTTAQIDDRAQVPGFGPMIHMASQPLNDRWVRDDAKIKW
jgi:hypothetical protein